MISVEEARAFVLEHAAPGEPITCLVTSAHGYVLAEEIHSSLDSPPYDKALMDGYAVRVADVAQPGARLQVVELLTAGQLPTREVTSGTATQIMTGAPIPVGADAVVMRERTESDSSGAAGQFVRVDDVAVRPGQNIMRRGESMRRGDKVLGSGHVLRGIEIGLLAEIGVQQVKVYPRPNVAILATGNELVTCDRQPQPGQIRNSNGPMLVSLVAESSGCPIDLGIAGDDEADLKRMIASGLEKPVLILSGGVSAGVLDLVPQVLKKMGVREVFHKIKMKPGKPLWFGVLSRDNGLPTLVFGLPGNPVSSLVCFLLFVRPALTRMTGETAEEIRLLPGILTTDFQQRGDRPTFHPGKARESNGSLLVEPLAWRGSADLRTLVDANVLVCFPANAGTLRAKDPVSVYLL